MPTVIITILLIALMIEAVVIAHLSMPPRDKIAKGKDLDRIALNFGFSREPFENDNKLRSRMMKWIEGGRQTEEAQKTYNNQFNNTLKQ